MASDRPYIGMQVDDLQALLAKSKKDYVRQLKLANDELKHRNGKTARVLHEWVLHELEALFKDALAQSQSAP